jgi:hypothetical protein
MPRLLDKDGLSLGCKVLPETRDALKAESRRQGRRRGAKGAELRGSAYVVNSLICWYLRLDKAERARIVDAGRILFDELLAGEEDGGENPAVTGAPEPGTGPPEGVPDRIERDPPTPRRKARGKPGRLSG